MRHSKTEPTNNNTIDFDRKLTQNGIQDAKKMGKYLANKVKPDVMLVSSAQRTRQTWTNIHECWGNIPTKFDSNLYLASSEFIWNQIQNLDSLLDTVLILGHNPGISEVINRIPKFRIDILPTSGVVCIEFNTDTFRNIPKCEAELGFFSHPSILD